MSPATMLLLQEGQSPVRCTFPCLPDLLLSQVPAGVLWKLLLVKIR